MPDKLLNVPLADRLRLLEEEADLRLERIIETAGELGQPNIRLEESLPTQLALNWAKDEDVQDFHRLHHAAKKHLEARVSDSAYMDRLFDMYYGRPDDSAEDL